MKELLITVYCIAAYIASVFLLFETAPAKGEKGHVPGARSMALILAIYGVVFWPVFLHYALEERDGDKT